MIDLVNINDIPVQHIWHKRHLINGREGILTNKLFLHQNPWVQVGGGGWACGAAGFTLTGALLLLL